MKTDDELFSAWRNGSRAAFTELYDRFEAPVFGYLYRSVSSQSVAQDLFQDVWAKVVAASKTYKQNNRFRSFLFTCAHNVVVDHYRRQQHRRTEGLDDQALCGQTFREDLVDVAEQIDAAIAKLPFDQRQAFHLREGLGCSIKEVANVQACSLEAAKSRLRYAYARIRESLEVQA